MPSHPQPEVGSKKQLAEEIWRPTLHRRTGSVIVSAALAIKNNLDFRV